MKLASTDDIFDLLEAYGASAALGAAMELGLFWLLAERPLDGPGVAAALDIPIKRCEAWLRFLSSIDLLECTANGYVPSATARATILDAYSQNSWSFLARESRERFPAVHDLPQLIHEPGSTWAAQGLTPPNYIEQMSQDPERARRFTRMLYELHRPFADDLARALDISSARRLIDLGGGSGVVSMALLRRYPELTAVVVDIPNVCAAGREIVRENSMEERISYLEANFVQDQLPAGFDVAIECDVAVYEPGLFRKVWSILNPGGRFIIVDQFPSPGRDLPPARLLGAFLYTLEAPESARSTAAAVPEMLAVAGFELLPRRTLAGKVLHSDDEWGIVEARKV